MTGGIHAEVAISDPDTCQVAPHSAGGEETVTGMKKTPDPGREDSIIEEYTVTKPVDTGPEEDVAVDEAEKLFEAGQREVFRFEREKPQSCVCEYIERHGCPVRDVTAVGGTLYVTFVAPDHETLQDALGDLATRYDGMNVCRLLRSEDSDTTGQGVFVDVGALTDRQHEVLTTAHEMGYFEHPRSASAADVATQLDIAKSTFTEHLAAAQRNLLDELLDE